LAYNLGQAVLFTIQIHPMAVENSEMLAELNKLDEAKETSMVIISQELFGDEFSNLKE
jgi:hypothetical protein